MYKVVLVSFPFFTAGLTSFLAGVYPDPKMIIVFLLFSANTACFQTAVFNPVVLRVPMFSADRAGTAIPDMLRRRFEAAALAFLITLICCFDHAVIGFAEFSAARTSLKAIRIYFKQAQMEAGNTAAVFAGILFHACMAAYALPKMILVPGFPADLAFTPKPFVSLIAVCAATAAFASLPIVALVPRRAATAAFAPVPIVTEQPAAQAGFLILHISPSKSD